MAHGQVKKTSKIWESFMYEVVYNRNSMSNNSETTVK